MVWKALLPRSPLRNIRTKEGKATFEWAKNQLKREKVAQCPECGHSPLTPVNLINEEHDQGHYDQVFLTCETCDYSVDVTDEINNAQQHTASYASVETTYLYTAAAMFFGTGFLAFILSNFVTFIGGALLTLVLIAYSFQASYRHWQIVNRRMFEATPPIKDFLKSYLRK
ncbi:hypothetical protein OIV19_18430 [Brucella sp. HL-2]|nr:hypothetical protein [Brucella sp. HL-2]MCV9909581.1 hypothetical protein [Brucella sp. HL-2]